ncbi:MAG TPA: hypothetical protein VG796_26435 [Verrucomicrobiales bacterium]|nr:hypothetical protein [Verrucomicrobiales bacterium]
MLIDLPETLLQRLHKFSTSFEDTPLSVIERWGDFYEKHHSGGGVVPKKSTPPDAAHALVTELVFHNDDNLPGFRHSTVRGSFGNRTFTKWNELLEVAHIEAFKKAGSFEELRKVTRARIRLGAKSDEGYRYLPDVNLSVQGVDADHAWHYSVSLASYLKVQVRARVEWRQKEGAAHPGKSAEIIWAPT